MARTDRNAPHAVLDLFFKSVIYKSNLSMPEIQDSFKHLHCRPMGHSAGHSVLSDFADRPLDDPVFGLYKNCGFWTHDEAAILFTIAQQLRGVWLDIGAHTGWTSAVMAEAGCMVDAIDPMLRVPEFAQRFTENTKPWAHWIRMKHETSNEWFAALSSAVVYTGVAIDGDHSEGKPLEDAKNAARHLNRPGVILFHDFWGWPVQEAVMWLMSQGFKARVYLTPHGVAACWRGEFTPPDHVSDQGIYWPRYTSASNEFPWDQMV
jgi:hypothetical protein